MLRWLTTPQIDRAPPSSHFSFSSYQSYFGGLAYQRTILFVDYVPSHLYLTSSYSTLFGATMGFAVNSTLAGILLFAVYVYRLQVKRSTAARQHGCGTLAKPWPKEPFYAFDFGMAMHLDIPILYRHHQRRGPTFQAHALLSQPSIITIAPANIRVVNTGKDWGVAPMRLAGMEYFCGRGFLTTDGDLWSRSRKLLKPTFNKANLTNLSFLSAQVDTMLQQLPKNGTTVDLQPLFYTMVRIRQAFKSSCPE